MPPLPTLRSILLVLILREEAGDLHILEVSQGCRPTVEGESHNY